ncbi:MAG: hypothetical protein NC092_12940 [Butyrivibrio sp.]|nr:hypothetical protein [Butyrivibrio sp.]
MNIKASQTSLFRYRNQSVQNNTLFGRQSGAQGAGGDTGASQTTRLIRRMLSQTSNQSDSNQSGSNQNNPYQNALSTGNIVSDTISYADSVRMSREKTKNTNLQLKKLQYNFKSLSAQILRSKTSVNAKQVASKARREVIRLKAKRRMGEYSDDEIECAIQHAQAMERVAKKKARHLQEEEMVKVTGGPCMADIEEREDMENRPVEEKLENALAEQVALEDGTSGIEDEMAAAVWEQMQAYQDMLQTQTAELQDMMEEMRWLMEEMSDSMRETLENTGLSELEDSMLDSVEIEMDPADFKMMKIKHRSKELQAIAKADAEYLKAVFDRLENAKSSAAQSFGSSGGSYSAPAGGVMVISGGSPTSGIDIVSAPSDPMAAPAAAGGLDVSI